MTRLIILILAIGWCSAAGTSEQNSVKFFSNELPLMLEKYYVEQQSTVSDVKASVYTRNANRGIGDEHLVDISLISNKERLELNFSKAKHSVATKLILGEITKLELDFHKLHFVELIRRLVFLAPGEAQKQIWFNTVFDLGSTLTKLAKSGEYKLSWAGNNSVLNAIVKKENSVILHMQVSAEEEVSDGAALGVSFRNWSLKIKLLFSEKNDIFTRVLILPVFTKTDSSLTNVNAELDRILGASSMINTLVDAKKVFGSELKSRFTLSPDTGSFDFKLISEISEAVISIKETITPEGLTGFNVVVSNGSLTRSVDFYRMKEKDIGKVLDQLRLADFIKTLYDEILESFKRVGNEEQAKISPTLLTFNDLSKTSNKGCTMVRGNDTLLTFAYSESKKDITLKISSDRSSMVHTHEFARSKFNRNLLEAVFRALIQNSINFRRVRL